ncbi:MAG: heavy-metal-associated domain-containing protein, partial [Thermoanaerobaculia bacterium]
MKKRLFLVVLLLVLAGVVASGLFVYATEDGAESNAELESVSFEVQGMQSLMCEMAVKSTLKSLDGVDAVSVDRKAATAEVTFDPATVSPAAFVEAVNSIGYRASLPEGVTAYADRGPADSLKPAGHPASASKLTPDHIEIVAAFVAGYILSKEEIPTGKDVVEATGVELSIADTPVLQRAVLTKLADDPRGQKLLAGSRCSDYGACSLWGNLAGASGDTLAMYEREKALDGKIFDDFAVPAFEARNLAGEVVRSSDLVGRPAIVAFLAVHCNHSMDTFPILQELHRRYGQEG